MLGAGSAAFKVMSVSFYCKIVLHNIADACQKTAMISAMRNLCLLG